MTTRVGVAFLLLVLPTPATAQSPATYRPANDPTQFLSDNSYHLYFVQGADTVGRPTMSRVLETVRFTKQADNLDVWVKLESLGGPAFESENTYTVTPTGRVLLIEGVPADEVAGARVDLLPRFADPPMHLEVGDKWFDTVSVGGTQPYGEIYYRVDRNYQVVAALDTLGTQALFVVSDGQISMRQGGWQDSVAGSVWWQEVSGTVTDSVWFDQASGRLLGTSTTIDLTGTGGAGSGPAAEVMPSGLRSTHRRVLQNDP